jgi:hypothetical protein
MNDKDKEAFEKWCVGKFNIAPELVDEFKHTFIHKLRHTGEAWEKACEYKQKEIDELKLEYDKLTDWASEYVDKNRKLKECVKWYADPKNCDNIDFTHCEWCERTEEEIADAGFRARQCLKELNENN